MIAYGGTKGNGYTDGGDQGGYSLNGGTTVVAGQPRISLQPRWMAIGAAVAAPDTPAIRATCNWAARVPRARITGSTVYYAGGGGAPSSYSSSGGTGYNVGGGGSGPAAFGGRAFSGLANTGGGGGGGWGGGGGAGGSGVVIVAYQAATTYTVTFNSNGGSSVDSQSVAIRRHGHAADASHVVRTCVCRLVFQQSV